MKEHTKIKFNLLTEEDIKKMAVSFVVRYPFKEEHRQHLERLMTAYETIYKPAQKEAELKESQGEKPVIKALSEQRVITNLSGKLQNPRKSKA